MLTFEVTKRTDERLLDRMKIHYSQPKGFVGRNICIAIYYNNVYYGHIVFGSATLHLIGRVLPEGCSLLNVANNLFFNISKVDNKYPCRNFTSLIIKEMHKLIPILWKQKYGDNLYMLETLVELPRTGELYLRSGWKEVGVTKGYTCKRISGDSSDSWSGKRVWNTNKDQLRPKKVLVYYLNT